jgi:glycosyltransferase involved in cell wall biosynthesis
MLPKRVCMLVWNGFVHDARITKEAETLIAHDYDVTVVAIQTPERPVASETLESGIHVVRVRRDCRWCRRLLFVPRWLARRIVPRRNISTAAPDEKDPWSEEGARPPWIHRVMSRVVELAVNWRLFRAAAAAKPTIVHANDVNVLAPAWLASRAGGAKLVYDAHEISADREGYHGIVWLVRGVERFLGGSASGFISTTDYRVNWFVENYGYENTLVLQNRPRYSRVARTDTLRRACGIDNDDPIVLYQGGLQWGRGCRNLIAAASDIDNINVVFLGGGGEEAVLRREAGGSGARVYFHPTVSLKALPAFTASADIGIQTMRNTCLNHYSNDSNKLFEYIMAGLPVVASDFPEMRKIVRGHSVGLVVDPGDVKAIREAIQRLVTDRELYEACRANTFEAAREFSWETQEAAFARLYDNLAA